MVDVAFVHQTKPVSAPPMSKNYALEGLRGCAAIAVMLAHSLFAIFPYLTSRRAPYEGATPKTIVDALLFQPPFNLLLIADAAVLIFFVLSGYVLTIRYMRERSTEAMQSAAVRRYIRLILPAAASVIFAWVLLSTGAMRNSQVGVLDLSGWPIHYYDQGRSLFSAIISGLWGVPFTGDTYLNGPLWSIQIEFLGSMLLFSVLAVFGRHSLLLSAIAFVVGVRFLAGFGSGALYYLAILSGFGIHSARHVLTRRPGVALIAGLAGLFLVTVDSSGQYSWLLALPLPNLNPILPDLSASPAMFWQLVGAWLLVLGVIGSPALARFFGARIPVYFGRVSYAVYLLHMPLIMSVLIGGIEIGRSIGLGFVGAFLFGFALFLVALFVLAEAFTRFVDDKAIHLAWLFERRLLSTRKALRRE